MMSVQMVKKHKMARLLPNGLAIITNTSQKVSESEPYSLVSLPIAAPGAHSLTQHTLMSLFTPPLCFLSMSQYDFVSLLSQDSVYDMLRKVCTHLQVWSSGAGFRPGMLLKPGLKFWDKAVAEGSPFFFF